MADIVNQKSEKKFDRKKYLYEHVSFDNLYEYNETIQAIRSLSKKLFSHYISSGVNAISTAFFKAQESDNVDLRSLGVSLPIEQYLEEEDAESGPKEILFTVQQVIDGYDIEIDPDRFDEMYSQMMEYITLGMYPNVVAPMSEIDLFRAFEKYDEIGPGRTQIGTIVGLLMHDLKIYAIVMWDPNYTMEMPHELLATCAGDLRMRDLSKTPSVWKDLEKTSVINFGIPMYEYSPMRMTLSNILYVVGFTDYINEAVVTGNLELDFVNTMMHKASEQISQAVQTVLDVQNTTVADGSFPQNVLIEDASENDIFGHRMRLYSAADNCDDEASDLATGMEAEIC